MSPDRILSAPMPPIEGSVLSMDVSLIGLGGRLPLDPARNLPPHPVVTGPRRMASHERETEELP